MAKLDHLWPAILKSSKLRSGCPRFVSKSPYNYKDKDSDSKDNEKNDGSKKIRMDGKYTKLEDIEVPTNCCMSGCPNCVWISYAEKLSEVLKDSPDDIRRIIMEKVEDPNMRAFLMSELKQIV